MKPTIECIESACDEFGDCLLWRGAVNDSGIPYAYLNSKTHNLRRFITNLRGKKFTDKQQIIPVCGNGKCLSASCLKVMSRSDAQKLHAQRGIYSTPRLSEARSQGRRKSGAGLKLNIEAVRDIRGGELSAVEYAKKYGVSLSLIGQVLRHEIWRDGGAVNSSVFTWRPAA